LKILLKTILATLLLGIFCTFCIQFLFREGENEQKEEVLGEKELKGDVKISGFIRLQEIKFTVYPEKRQPQPSHIDNWSTGINFKVQDPITKQIILDKNTVTNKYGQGVINLLYSEIVPDGKYNILLKGTSHLTKKYALMNFSHISENFDFRPYGDLLAGDINPVRDDIVNSLDMSLLIGRLGENEYVTDLNQDAIINSLDLSILEYNLSKIGNV